MEVDWQKDVVETHHDRINFKTRVRCTLQIMQMIEKGKDLIGKPLSDIDEI